MVESTKRILCSDWLAELAKWDFASVHKRHKKEVGQCPAVLTSRSVNNAYALPYTLQFPLAPFVPNTPIMM